MEGSSGFTLTGKAQRISTNFYRSNFIWRLCPPFIFVHDFFISLSADTTMLCRSEDPPLSHWLANSTYFVDTWSFIVVWANSNLKNSREQRFLGSKRVSGHVDNRPRNDSSPSFTSFDLDQCNSFGICPLVMSQMTQIPFSFHPLRAPHWRPLSNTLNILQSIAFKRKLTWKEMFLVEGYKQRAKYTIT